MKKLITIAYCLAISYLEADVSLRNLIQYGKATCIERLEKADTAELWDVFLEGQATLFFDAEFQWIANRDWWAPSERILEIGSGNGAYLSRLAGQFHEKTFQGVEILPLSVKQANEHYAGDNLAFREGDVEIFDAQLIDTADIILFRLTLQHLKDSSTALKHAADYLLPNGYVLIIDACDMAKRTSHPISALDEALRLVAQTQNKNGKGNRKVTLELLQTLENGKSPLSELYEVVFSNLDSSGNILFDTIRFEGAEGKRLYFNHSLLFLNLLHRTYQIPIDLNKAYDELKAYFDDENAWSTPGMHYLVLKRKAK
ncbi:MAG: methyltransferase domain-containing protein [Verrucomicrobia bacterium]|nr:methyltransferase domain-containing protein [Verrucomicrobiota bacterium]